MAVPRRRASRRKKRMRRAHHDVLKMPGLALCSRCGEPKLPHRACLSCGFYKTKQVIFPKQAEESVEE